MTCKHTGQIDEKLVQAPPGKSHAKGCEECVKAGMGWVHLRECLVCGHVGCCDSSVGKHATRHFHATKHAVIRTVEPGENWAWCYVDQAMLQL